MVAAGDLQFNTSIAGLDKNEPIALFKSGSIRIANLEMCLTGIDHRADKPIQLRTDPSLSPILEELGCQVLSFANNHALDFGEGGFLDTLDRLKELGLTVLGAGRNLPEARAPKTVSVGKISVSMLAFSSTYGPGSRAGASKPGISYVRVDSQWGINAALQSEQPGSPPSISTSAVGDDLDAIIAVVAEAAKESDLVVVVPHWGVAYRYDLTDYQRQVAHELVDAGADFIFGGHPHIFQAVERYRSGVIFYSLGNFLFQFTADETITKHRPSLWKHWSRHGLMIEVQLIHGEADEATIYPLQLDDRGVPAMARGRQAEYILETLSLLSELEGTHLRVDSTASRACI
jgi:poly-gamma-glutamate capsule biosynthesis protein CapA/YwtB (metallophosphatase superfamily)